MTSMSKILMWKAEYERTVSDLKELDHKHELAVLNELKTYIDKKKRLIAHLESINNNLNNILNTNKGE